MIKLKLFTKPLAMYRQGLFLLQRNIFRFGSTLKINEIPYQQQNISMLSSVLSLPPSKQSLSQHYQRQLHDICPQIQIAKSAFIKLQQKTSDLYQYIKKVILTQPDIEINKQFFEKAHYYFNRQGKKVRPLMIIQLSQNLKSLIKKANKNINFDRLDEQIRKWAALMEIMHIASLSHDDVVDNSLSRRGQLSQHIKYGKKMSVFSGNYVISKASKTISEYNSAQLYQIFSYTMENLSRGEIKQFLSKQQNKFMNEKEIKIKEFMGMITRYMEKTYFKSAALMCGALFGVPTIFQHHFKKVFQEAMGKQLSNVLEISFRVGQHYGLGFQLIDDVLDYISTKQQMGKQEMSDLIEGNVTAPVYFTYKFKDSIIEKGKGVTLQLLNKSKKNKDEALAVKKWVESGVGIELTYIIGAMHIKEGIKQLKKLGIQEHDLMAWRYLGHRFMTRRN